MEQKLLITGRFPSFNDIIKANRGTKAGHFVGNNQKQKYTDLVAWKCKEQGIKPFEKQIDVTIHWFCKNKMRDKDGIMAGQKFIFDGLQRASVIPNDGWTEIGDISHKFSIDKENERVEITMVEVEDGTRSL